jgi:hypothetical protein
MKFLASRKAAWYAVFAAAPFVGYSSIVAIGIYQVSRWPLDDLSWTKTWLIMFFLGCPLTLLYVWCVPYIGKFLILSIGTNLKFLLIPVFELVFIIQWVIWSQLIALAWRRWHKKITDFWMSLR